jgi:phosphoribosylformylglycinamidine synthase
MAGSSLPIPVSHAEGRATFSFSSPSPSALAPLHYVDPATLRPTDAYPFNPNGSAAGVAAVRSRDGRVLAMMPHPERVVLGGTGGMGGGGGGDFGPWIRLFQGARRWVG